MTNTTLAFPDDESPFDSIRETDEFGNEYWRARRLQPLMAYTNWRQFGAVIDRAIAAAANVGVDVSRNFEANLKDAGQTGPAPKDFKLSRDAAYLVAMNGDPRKPEVAAAQAYFVAKTRQAEDAQKSPALPADYEQALIALLSEVREKKGLERRVAELTPAATAWEKLAAANGDFSVRVSANMLNRDPNILTGQNRLFAVIRGLGMVSKGDIPYAKHADRLRLKAGSVYKDPKTKEETLGDPQLRVTIRGLQYIHKRLGGVVPIQYHVQAELEFDGAEDGAA